MHSTFGVAVRSIIRVICLEIIDTNSRTGIVEFGVRSKDTVLTPGGKEVSSTRRGLMPSHVIAQLVAAGTHGTSTTLLWHQATLLCGEGTCQILPLQHIRPTPCFRDGFLHSRPLPNCQCCCTARYPQTPTVSTTQPPFKQLAAFAKARAPSL